MLHHPHVLPVQGKVLQRIPGLSHEAAAVVWTMVERQDPESTLSHFWRALPQHLGTGLSVREGHLHRVLPRGSPLREEAEAARKVRCSWRAGQQVWMCDLTRDGRVRLHPRFTSGFCMN